MPPKGAVSIAKNAAIGATGVLPINPAALHSQNSQPKSAIRLKLELRRLPPGLTQDEYLAAFGDEWNIGAGKVDWLEYRQGKLRGPGKLHEQSRAYIHLTNESHIKAFEAKFLSITFEDAKGTHKDPNLKHLPPTLGFAPSQRIPAAKQRVDGRQGTIDQDPEFIAFLEGETQPVAKPAALENSADKTKEKITTTPLIDDLRERKAIKAKTAAAKAAKAKEEKASEKAANGKAAKLAQPEVGMRGGSKASQPPKDTTKPAKTQSAKATAAAPSPAAASATASPSLAPIRKRDRVTPNAIKSMLQRDLGLTTPPKRAGKQSTTADSMPSTQATADSAAAVAAPSDTGSITSSKGAKGARTTKKAPLTEKGNGQTPQPDAGKPAPTAPTGILKKATSGPSGQKAGGGPKEKPGAATAAVTAPASNASAKTQPPVTTTTTTAQKPSKVAPTSTSGASSGSTKAYLKHANASQGITEQLLSTALSVFGEVVSVEIDKRKGTALAEFKDIGALKTAMAKRNLPVAQGAVEILEYKDKPAPQAGRGGGAAGRGGSVRGRGRGGGGRGGGGAAAAVAAAPGVVPIVAPVAVATAPALAGGGEGT